MVINKNKKILFLSPFYFPEEISTGKYNTYLVNALTKKGCDVEVISSYPFYPNWKPYNHKDTSDGVKVSRGGLFIRYPRSQVLKRIILETWFTMHVLKNVFRLRKDVDVVIAVFPPVLFMTAVFAIIPKSVLKVGIIHDVQGLMSKSTATYSRKLISKIIGPIEARIYRKCDRLICLSKSMLKMLVDDYEIDIRKSTYFYPFVTTNELVRKENQLSEIFASDYLHVVYSGALGEKQNPWKLIEFFERLCGDIDNLACHVFSRGPIFEQISNDFRSKQIEGLHFHDLVSEDCLLELFEKSTVHVVPQAVGVGAGAFPSKLPNLLAQGVPVFAICDHDSELASVVNGISYGKVVNVWDIEVMVEGIKSFLSEIKDIEHKEFQKVFKETVQDKFDADCLVNSLL